MSNYIIDSYYLLVQEGLLRIPPDLDEPKEMGNGYHGESDMHHMTDDEQQFVYKWNKKYKTKFGFHFIVCEMGDQRKVEIMKGLESRYENNLDQEIKTSMDELKCIAEMNLRSLLKDHTDHH